MAALHLCFLDLAREPLPLAELNLWVFFLVINRNHDGDMSFIKFRIFLESSPTRGFGTLPSL